jgi:hypothetical protein
MVVGSAIEERWFRSPVVDDPLGGKARTAAKSKLSRVGCRFEVTHAPSSQQAIPLRTGDDAQSMR